MSLFKRSLKRGPTVEYVCEFVFRPLAHLVVLALLPLRVSPPAVVIAAGGVGVAAAVELARGQLVSAAFLIVLKTVLDNADGQLARASGRISALGRYLDSESDLLVNAALFAALGYVTGRPFARGGGVRRVDARAQRELQPQTALRARARQADGSTPDAEGGACAMVRRITRSSTRRRTGSSRRLCAGGCGGCGRCFGPALHTTTAATILLLHNVGLSGQMAALAMCLAAGLPDLYLWLVLGCGGRSYRSSCVASTGLSGGARYPVRLGPSSLMRHALLLRERHE